MPHNTLEKRKEYLEKNKDRIRKKAKEYYLRNLKMFKEKTKRYSTNPKRIAYRKKYREENKDKAKGYKLLKTYNITLNDYNEMFKKQEGKCSICKKHQNELTKPLYVDHDHSTGKVRELLCSSCNFKLGILETVDRDIFDAYSKKHKGEIQ
jgi:hypothetical protein